jgi:Amt family ammonium transporter
MFAAITPAFIIGTYAWRIKFSAFLAFTVLWATFVYDPLGPGTGGWLKELGALDFDGGIVHTRSRRLRSRAGPSHRQDVTEVMRKL